MIIGIPVEQASQEKRVALSPGSVAGAIELGFTVYLQTGAGDLAGFPDDEYRDHGAKIVETAEQRVQDDGLRRPRVAHEHQTPST